MISDFTFFFVINKSYYSYIYYIYKIMDVKNVIVDKSIKERDTGNIDKITPPLKIKNLIKKNFIQNNSKSKNNKKKKSVKGY